MDAKWPVGLCGSLPPGMFMGRCLIEGTLGQKPQDCVLEKPQAHHDYGARKAYHAAGASNGGGMGATGTGPGKVSPCCSCQLWENIWRRCPCSGAEEGGTPEQGSTSVSSHNASPLSFPDDALV